MFKHTLRLITLLADQLNRGNEGFEHNLSESLLTELLYAGLNAPAFSEQQRWQLCRAAHPVDQRIRMSPIAPYWPFDVLGRKAGMDEDLVKVGRHPKPGFTGMLTMDHSSTQVVSRATTTVMGMILRIPTSAPGPLRATRPSVSPQLGKSELGRWRWSRRCFAKCSHEVQLP